MLVAAGFACSLHCILPWLGIKLDYVRLPNSAVVKLGRVIITILVILWKLMELATCDIELTLLATF
jgi:hypothetical protein